MKIIIFLFTIFVFIKTLLYGIYEFKNCKNSLGGFIVIAISVVCLIGPNILMQIR